jgi:DNA-binding XRE family transcriptional regulator
MKLERDWLWDRKITLGKARAILRNPQDGHFLSLSALLLSRKNTTKEVFRYYLKPPYFLRYWSMIKNKMRKDDWNNPRIEFWQAIYEALKKKYEKKGIRFVREIATTRRPNEFCKIVAEKLRSTRKEKGLTQNELAKRLKVSQQMISRIEKGKENVSLSTLKNLVDALGAQLNLEIT